MKTFNIPISIVILNIIFKGLFLSSNSVAGDEPFSVFYAQSDIISIIKFLSKGNNPPLYEILLHFWIKLFGISAFSVRIPSLIFNSITVLFLYKIGNKYFNLNIALTASLLFVFSDYQIMFAHEARVYALLGMLTTISVYLFLELITTEKLTKQNLIFLIISNILIIYSHYFGFFIIFFQVLFIIFNKTLRNKYLKQLLISLAIITLFYLPNINILINRFIFSTTNGTWVKPVSGLGNLHDALYWFSNNNKILYLSVILILYGSLLKLTYLLKINRYIKTIFVFGIIPIFFLISVSVFFSLPFIWRFTSLSFFISFFVLILLFIFILAYIYTNKEQNKYSYLIGIFILPLLIFFSISFFIPIFINRYLMFISIPFYLVIAIAADFLIKKRYFSYFLSIFLIVIYIITVNPNISNKRNVKETIAKLKELKTNNSIIYFCPNHFKLNFLYYYNINWFKDFSGMYTDKTDNCLHKDNIYPITDQSQIDTNKINLAEKTFYLDAAANFSYPNNNIFNKLNNILSLQNKYEFYKIFKIYEFNAEE